MKLVRRFLFVNLMLSLIFILVTKQSISQVTDIDGNVYKTVIIGNQEWMAENLKVTHYRNGNEIDKNSYINYTDSETSSIFGKLYFLSAVNSVLDLAPKGWRIPSEKDLRILCEWLQEDCGGKLKSTTMWNSPNTGATDVYDFSALPSGCYVLGEGQHNFKDIKKIGYFWMVGRAFSSDHPYFKLCFNSSNLIFDSYYIYLNPIDVAFSVRCVKN